MKKVDYVVMDGDETGGEWAVFSGRGALGDARNAAALYHGRLYRRVKTFDLRAGLDKATEELKLVEVFP